jgi:hypothetical protein
MSQELIINGTRTVQNLQDDFHAVYPDLKISFFHHSHDAGVPSEKSDAVSPETSLADIRSLENDGAVSIDPSVTVEEFEGAMRDHFGLSVQVFRRSGSQWIQTTITDHWTLGHQEEDGHESIEF